MGRASCTSSAGHDRVRLHPSPRPLPPLPPATDRMPGLRSGGQVYGGAGEGWEGKPAEKARDSRPMRRRKDGHRNASGDHRSDPLGSYGAVADQGAGAEGGAGTSVDLPLTIATEPIRAWKRAALVGGDGASIGFDGIGMGGRYEVDAHAQCRPSRSYYLGTAPVAHEAPAVDCKCGFYGLALDDERQPTRPHEPAQPYLLDVELFGRVIRHERGYRAARQKVLRVHVPTLCYRCGDRARRLGLTLSTTTLIPNSYGSSYPRTTPGKWQPTCGMLCGSYVSYLTLEQAAKRLGTEVDWLAA